MAMTKSHPYEVNNVFFWGTWRPHAKCWLDWSLINFFSQNNLLYYNAHLGSWRAHVLAVMSRHTYTNIKHAYEPKKIEMGSWI